MLSKIVFLFALAGVFIMCFSSFVRAVESRGTDHRHPAAHKLHGNGGKRKSIVIK